MFPLRHGVLEIRGCLLGAGGQGKVQLSGVSGCIFSMADDWGGGCLAVCWERGEKRLKPEAGT